MVVLLSRLFLFSYVENHRSRIPKSVAAINSFRPSIIVSCSEGRGGVCVLCVLPVFVWRRGERNRSYGPSKK